MRKIDCWGTPQNLFDSQGSPRFKAVYFKPYAVCVALGSHTQELKRSGRKVASIGCFSPLAISLANSSPTISASVAPE